MQGMPRAIAEVGAIIVVGGNIRGYTRIMTMTMAVSAMSLYVGRGLPTNQ